MNLKQTIVSAVGWFVAIKVSVQFVTWAMTLVVIRILSPDDYGLMAVSQVFVNFMLGFSSLGFGDALVQQGETPKAVVARLFGVLLVSAVVLGGLMALVAYPIGAWYHDERLIPLIQVSSLGFLFTALTALPRAYLTKELKVRPMFIMELSSGAAGTATVILLAFAGYGVWSLMYGWLVTNVVKLLGFGVLASEYYTWPRFGIAGIGPLFSFGIYRTFEYIVWMIFASADILIISRILGPVEVGVYVVASNFATMPLNKIAPIVNATAFPAFALVQERPSEARFYALKAVRMMAAIAVPLFFGLAVTAPEVVDLVFGPNWVAARPVLGVLALAVTFRAILLVVPNFLQGIGDSRASFWCTAIGALIFPPAFIIGCQWGIVGVAWAWLLGYPIMYAASAMIAARRGGLDTRLLLLAPVQPIIAGCIMMATVAATRLSLSDSLPEVVSFLILVMVGAATYGGVLLLLFRGLAMEVLNIFQRASSPADAPVHDPGLLSVKSQD
jgi:O-antigen/teichoic acid export membrane protein